MENTKNELESFLTKNYSDIYIVSYVDYMAIITVRGLGETVTLSLNDLKEFLNNERQFISGKNNQGEIFDSPVIYGINETAKK